MTETSLNSLLSFAGVTKRYGHLEALSQVTLDFPARRVIGLLGRNGAGKSTLLQIAAGLVLPDAGDCLALGTRVENLDSAELAKIGFVPQEPRFIEWMTVRQHLDFTGSLYPHWDAELEARLLESLELPDQRRIAELSTGDRQKLALVLGVSHRPQLLLLDEPMSSLDPIARNRALDLLIELLRDDGCTIVVSSHLLADVEKVADWLVFLSGGRVVESAPFDELQESFAEWQVGALHGGPLPVFTEPWILAQETAGRHARLRVRTRPGDTSDEFARRHGITVTSRPLTLDEIFPLLTAPRGK